MINWNLSAQSPPSVLDQTGKPKTITRFQTHNLSNPKNSQAFIILCESVTTTNHLKHIGCLVLLITARAVTVDIPGVCLHRTPGNTRGLIWTSEVA